MQHQKHYPPTSRRILHVVDSLEVGGLERVVTDLVLAQSAAGHHVCVFSICTTGGFKAELQAKGIEVLEGHKSGPLDRRVIRALRHCVRQHHIGVVHAHNFVPNYYAAAALLALTPQPALVCTCHDMGMRLQNRRLRWLFRMSLARTAHVAMVGAQVHQRFVHSGMVKPAHATTVLNGIPVERFSRTDDRRGRARQQLGLPPDATVIGAVGRLVPLKNHARLIQVMPEILRRHPDTRLVIIGDGELAATLRQEVAAHHLQDRVVLAGGRKDVADLLPAFDIFALPSQTEGLSIALLEACASQLAVVATQVGGNPEIIHEGHTGLLIPADNNAALTQALMRLLDDPHLRDELARHAQAWVRAHASIDALVQAYDQVYGKALQR